ncbi:MAG: ureidoacrylate peracid hydrolase [Porticoccaceae bacterium]|jgi:ureidoacrylate peracid hydrolase
MMSAIQLDQKRSDRWSLQDGYVSMVRDINPPRPACFAAQPEALCVDMVRSALIVIDMQNDFLDPDGWFASVRGAEVSELSTVIPQINDLSAAFRIVGAPVIHLNWGVRADLANLPANVLDKGSACGRTLGYGDAIETGDVLVEGSWGASSVPSIDQHESDISVAKHRLSGFRDNELEQILRRLDIKTVFYTGVNLDRCVFATLMDGCFHGFDAVLVEDATSTVSPDYVGEAITYLIHLLYGFTTSSADLLLALESIIDQGETT